MTKKIYSVTQQVYSLQLVPLEFFGCVSSATKIGDFETTLIRGVFGLSFTYSAMWKSILKPNNKT